MADGILLPPMDGTTMSEDFLEGWIAGQTYLLANQRSTPEHLANRMGATFVPEPPKYSAAWISQRIGQRSWLPLRDCSICGKDVGYVVNHDQVWFRSSCGCVRYEDRRSSFQEIADLLAAQDNDEHRDGLMARMLGK